jgi:hypothetical protein
MFYASWEGVSSYTDNYLRYEIGMKVIMSKLGPELKINIVMMILICTWHA